MALIPVYVFLAERAAAASLSLSLPPAREEEISFVRNERVKEEKRAVFSLLSLAVKHVYGADLDEVGLFRCPTGGWRAEKFYISLSHTDGYVAVALSNQPVGIDAQTVMTVPRAARTWQKIATPLERQRYAPTPLSVTALWTAKESVFKTIGVATFLPSQTETVDCHVSSFLIGTTVFSVAAQSDVSLTVFLYTGKAVQPLPLSPAAPFSLRES